MGGGLIPGFRRGPIHLFDGRLEAARRGPGPGTRLSGPDRARIYPRKAAARDSHRLAASRAYSRRSPAFQAATSCPLAGLRWAAASSRCCLSFRRWTPTAGAGPATATKSIIRPTGNRARGVPMLGCTPAPEGPGRRAAKGKVRPARTCASVTLRTRPAPDSDGMCPGCLGAQRRDPAGTGCKASAASPPSPGVRGGPAHYRHARRPRASVADLRRIAEDGAARAPRDVAATATATIGPRIAGPSHRDRHGSGRTRPDRAGGHGDVPRRRRRHGGR